MILIAHTALFRNKFPLEGSRVERPKYADETKEAKLERMPEEVLSGYGWLRAAGK